jgi:hypothetical protein
MICRVLDQFIEIRAVQSGDSLQKRHRITSFAALRSPLFGRLGTLSPIIRPPGNNPFGRIVGVAEIEA